MTDDHMRREPETDPSLPFRLTADDLLSDLAWPRLFHAPRLALRSGRIGIGVAIVLVLSLVDQVLAAMAGGETVVDAVLLAVAAAAGNAGDRLATMDAGGALGGLVLGYTDAIHSVWVDAPLRTILLIPLTLVIVSFGQVAIGRLASLEFARGRFGSWTDGMRWAAGCLGGIAVAVLLPLVVASLLVGVLVAGGWALLSIPFVNVVGAILGVVGLLIAMACVLILVGYALGAPLFASAIAVEGPDGIDAMHRTYAYLLARPARFVLYAALLAVQGLVVVSVLAMIAGLTVSLGMWATSLLLSEEASLVASGVSSDRLGPGGRAAASVMHVVLQLPALVVAGYAFAYWSSACTMLYLVLRRTVDGQDMVDVLVPGEIDAKIDAVMAERGEAIAHRGDRPA